MPIPLRFKAAWDDSALMAGIRRTSGKINRIASWSPGKKSVGGFGRGGRLGGESMAMAGLAGISKVTNEADALYNLSRKTGIATNSLAALAEMSKTANIETEQLASAVVRMQVNLSKNTPEVTKAIDDMGLSLEELDAMHPADQFIAIGSALAQMGDGMEKVRASQALFGRGGSDLFEFFDTIGTMDMAKISKNAKMMGESAKHLAEAKDIIDTYMFGVNARAAKMMVQGLKGDIGAMLWKSKDETNPDPPIVPPVRIGSGSGALDVGRKEFGLRAGGIQGASGLGIYGTEGGTGTGAQKAYNYIKRGDAKIAKEGPIRMAQLKAAEEARDYLKSLKESMDEMME